MSENRYYLPITTRESLYNSISKSVFSNFSLFYHKYPAYGKESEKDKPKFIIPESWDFKIRDLENSARIYKYIDKLNLKTTMFCMKTDWRMQLGLGSESVYETSLTLHHIYGFPYIPGQAVKGLLRNYIINEYFSDELEQAKSDKRKDIDKLVEKDESFVYLFGSQKKKGHLIFFDALPVTIPKIEQDVMTPHFGKYYSNEKPPADYLFPVPVKFLTVKDTSFVFVFGRKEIREEDLPKSGKLIENCNSKSILEFVRNNTVNALTEYGIGAKTAVGYGYLKDYDSNLPKEYQECLNKMVTTEEKEKMKIIELQKRRIELQKRLIDNFSLDICREFFKGIKSEENIDEKLLNQLIDALLDNKNYELLKKTGQHFEMINDVFIVRDFLKEKKLDVFLENIDRNFGTIINKYGSKKKKKEWKELIKT